MAAAAGIRRPIPRTRPPASGHMRRGRAQPSPPAIGARASRASTPRSRSSGTARKAGEDSRRLGPRQPHGAKVRRLARAGTGCIRDVALQMRLHASCSTRSRIRVGVSILSDESRQARAGKGPECEVLHSRRSTWSIALAPGWLRPELCSYRGGVSAGGEVITGLTVLFLPEARRSWLVGG